MLELKWNDNSIRVKPRDANCKELVDDLYKSIQSPRKINIWRKSLLYAISALFMTAIVNDVVTSTTNYNHFEYLVILFMLFYFVSYKMLAHIFHHVVRDLENNSVDITNKLYNQCVNRK
jgi:hypothetical protein